MTNKGKEPTEEEMRECTIKGQELEIQVLTPVIRSLWCRETARPSCQVTWREDTPAVGQDDVTALLVQDICGGDIMVVEVPNFGSYYYNRLFTKDMIVVQEDMFVEIAKDCLPAGVNITEEASVTPVNSILKLWGNRERFALLKYRFFRLMTAHYIGQEVAKLLGHTA